MSPVCGILRVQASCWSCVLLSGLETPLCAFCPSCLSFNHSDFFAPWQPCSFHHSSCNVFCCACSRYLRIFRSYHPNVFTNFRNYDHLCGFLPASTGGPCAFLPTLRDMGYTITALGHTSDGLGGEFESGSIIPQNVRASEDTDGPPASYSSKLPERRPRPAKSHTLQRKKRKATTNKISRSYSVETGCPIPLSPIGPPRWDRKLVRFCVRQYMRREVHLMNMPFRQRSPQA